LGRFVLVAGGVAGLLVLGGCGQGPGEDAAQSPVATEGLVDDDDGDFVRDVLADGEVTEAEYAEAKERTLACLAEEAGMEGSYVPDGISGQEGLVYDGDYEMTPDQLTADRKCHSKWMGQILEIHNEHMVNPFNEDMEALTVECLIVTGLAPEGFTVGDLRELHERQTVDFGPEGILDEEERAEAYSRPGITVNPADDSISALLPSGVPMSDQLAMECEVNPKAHGVGKSTTD
jgi:hypothetical protein